MLLGTKMPSTVEDVEKTLRAMLWEFGLRFRTNESVLGTLPSITVANCKVVVFVQSCELDKCPWHGSKRAGAKHWKALDARDQRLRKAGWTVLRVWQHEIDQTPKLVAGRLSLIVKTVQKAMTKA